ncbi:ATP-binding protein [Sphingobium bisphenolivorans]|uniref:ATP-binding protein n=1 Tax=Sphingobium bisphenolivorans TaxID=1335760 RepID=UPI0003AA208C|nr:ATP-binding protein [Sphingobium bisphenolivorans]
MLKSLPESHRVLVSAPYGCDASSMETLLRAQGYDAVACGTLSDIAGQINEDTGAILITEEALAADLGPLHRALEAQPHWSDIPFILLAGRQAGRTDSSSAVRRRLPESAINVVLLERPLSSESLLSAVASAVRSRQKQFEIRDRIAELNGQKNQLSLLLDLLPVGVAFADMSGSVLLSNPAFRKFQPDGQIPSHSPDGEDRWIAYEEDGSRVTRDRFVARRAMRGEVVQGVEFLYHPHSGRDVWTRVSGLPLLDPAGKVAGSICVVVNIDEQMRAQEALTLAAQRLEDQVAERTVALQDALARLKQEAEERERAEAALRQSQKMEAVGQLTGGIAHDFNNMLTGVIGAIDIMKRRIGARRYDDLDKFMDAASASAQRAAGLTQRLLAFSRRQSLDSRPSDVNALVASLEDLLKRTMSEQIEVSIVQADAMPLALVDPNQLENAILNLSINARDAMPEGGRLVIETSSIVLDDSYTAAHPGIAAGEYVVVAVSDTGVGMDREILDKVFEPFFTTKPIGQGTGLGLSMVYGFAKQSKGQVRIHSTPGIGTSVKIYLPIADGADQAAAETAGQQVHEGEGQLVLLVEDDNSVRLLIGDVLEELGYASVQAAEPEQAIALLESGRRFDLMISDVGLPGMNGRQLAEVARSHLPDLPILFVTGYAENAAVRSGFLGTNMSMITKPFQIEALSAKIKKMLA